MKNNVSFLLVTATTVAAMALCFGSVASFDTVTPQVASSTAPAPEVAPATSADATLRIE
jgi:hypothetical protein